MTGFHVDPGPRLVRIPGGVEPDPGPDGPGRQGVGQDVPGVPGEAGPRFGNLLNIFKVCSL